MARIALLYFIFLPLLVLAQTPPPEVDQALRARVTEFLQYHVDGNFRKAYDMVAEDTKDAYFGSSKAQLTSFKIDNIKFSDDFTKATVTATMSKTMTFAPGQALPTTRSSDITWKIENDKWVWYEASAKPMAPVSSPSAANAGEALPQKFDDQTIAAAARSILQQVSVDKQEVTLAADNTSEEKVIFHNGMTGSVLLELTVPEIPGFSAKVEQSMVRAAQDVPVVFRYEPNGKLARRDPITVQLTVQPLGQIFTIRVNFSAAVPLR